MHSEIKNNVYDNLYSGDNAKIHSNLINHDLSNPSSIKPSPVNSEKEESKVYSVFYTGSADPFTPCDYSAYEAALHVDGQDNFDIRPRVLDGNTKELTLIDSGSQVCLVKAGPEDVLDPTIRLESVGGDILPCYGKVDLWIQLGRKQYKIPAIKAKVKETILGWNFIKTYRMIV